MPFGGGKTATLNVSGMAWDADLVVPAAYKITVDHVAETTGGHGIVTDSLLAPAVGATLAAGQVLRVDHIGEATGAHGIVYDHLVKVDHIAERTGAHGIVTDSLLAPAVGATLAAGQLLKADHIAEVTGGHGIVHDNVVDAGTHAIINVVDPTNPQDAETKAVITAAGYTTPAAMIAICGYNSVASATVLKAITGARQTDGILVYGNITIPLVFKTTAVFRISVSIKTEVAGNVCTVYIRKSNDATLAGGTFTNTTESYVAYTLDIPLSDLLADRIVRCTISGSGASNAFANDFSVKGTISDIPVW